MAHNPNEGFCNFQYVWQPSSHCIQTMCVMAGSVHTVSVCHMSLLTLGLPTSYLKEVLKMVSFG